MKELDITEIARIAARIVSQIPFKALRDDVYLRIMGDFADLNDDEIRQVEKSLVGCSHPGLTGKLPNEECTNCGLVVPF